MILAGLAKWEGNYQPGNDEQVQSLYSANTESSSCE